MIETIAYQGALLAIIIPDRYSEPGVNFFTPDNFSQQVAFISHTKGKTIEPHFHNPVPREVLVTQEVLHIKTGRIRVDFYSDQQDYLQSRILRTGDTIVLVSGGHGFEILDDIEMIEVKQGPYLGNGDKTRFPGICTSKVFVPESQDDSSQ